MMPIDSIEKGTYHSGMALVHPCLVSDSKVSNAGISGSSGLKGHPFTQPGLKALEVGVPRNGRAESPAIRWSMSPGDSSNGQPVGPMISSCPETRAFCPGWKNDRPFGPEETPFIGYFQCIPPGKPCPAYLLWE